MATRMERLIDILKTQKNFPSHQGVPLIVDLKTDENIGLLLDYLDKNPNATKSQIINKKNEILAMATEIVR